MINIKNTISKLVRYADKNQDGKISPDEWLKLAQGILILVFALFKAFTISRKNPLLRIWSMLVIVRDFLKKDDNFVTRAINNGEFSKRRKRL